MHDPALFVLPMVHAQGDTSRGDVAKCARSAFTLLLDGFRRRDRFMALQARSEYEAANRASQEVGRTIAWGGGEGARIHCLHVSLRMHTGLIICWAIRTP
jgi:hypothetical protein